MNSGKSSRRTSSASLRPNPLGVTQVRLLRRALKVEIQPKQLIEKNADDRGRITLGSDYANENVKVLIIDE